MRVKQRHAIGQLRGDQHLTSVVDPLSADCSPVVAEVILNGGRLHLVDGISNVSKRSPNGFAKVLPYIRRILKQTLRFLPTV